MPVLTIETGPAKGRTFELAGKTQSIGRSGDIQILDTAASRKHAEIFKLGEMRFIRDLDSRNGTYVNEVRISKETPLRVGDRIRIGSSLLVFGKEPDEGERVEFVQDSGIAESTVEIKLGEQAARVVSGNEPAKTESTMGRLFTMYEVARTLGRETSLQGVVDKVLDFAMNAVQPTYCYIFIRDESTGNLSPKAWRDPQRLQRREISRSIVMRAMRMRHSIMTADAATDERFDQSESVVIGEIRSVICAPLVARDRINGVMYMGRDSAAEPFDDADLELATAIAFQSGIALENLAIHDERQTELMALVKMSAGAMDLRTPELRGHNERTAAYAAAVADKLGLSKEESDDVMLAALLHDVGKAPIDENIRLAVGAALGQSVQEEFCHAFLGARMLEELPGLARIIPGVKYHHERLDGFGGHEGLSGEAIPLIARIVAVANRFDHFASDPVRDGQPMPLNEALEAVEQPGEGLDDAITHALVEAQRTGGGIQLPKLVLQEFC
jgi:HD-GYP domain-containing protein (c-di-GMP phosphodiesterase class II)/pSer/pThr/pTyr-binding forkhead associated (FHA) protein